MFDSKTQGQAASIGDSRLRGTVALPNTWMAPRPTGCSPSRVQDNRCSIRRLKGKQRPSAIQGSGGPSPSRTRGWRHVRQVVRHRVFRIIVVRFEFCTQSMRQAGRAPTHSSADGHRRFKAPGDRRPPERRPCRMAPRPTGCSPSRAPIRIIVVRFERLKGKQRPSAIRLEKS